MLVIYYIETNLNKIEEISLILNIVIIFSTNKGNGLIESGNQGAISFPFKCDLLIVHIHMFRYLNVLIGSSSAAVK